MVYNPCYPLSFFASLSTIMLRMRRILGSAYLLLQLVVSQSIYDEEEVKVVDIVTLYYILHI